MADSELTKNDSICPICDILLEYKGEGKELRHLMDYDEINDTYINVRDEYILTYIWGCPKCGVEVSLTQ